MEKINKGREKFAEKMNFIMNPKILDLTVGSISPEKANNFTQRYFGGTGGKISFFRILIFIII